MIFCRYRSNTSLRKMGISNLLISLLKEAVVSDTVTGHLINILHLIGILMSSASFIEEFFVLRVVELVVLRVCDIGPIIPCWNGT